MSEYHTCRFTNQLGWARLCRIRNSQLKRNESLFILADCLIIATHSDHPDRPDETPSHLHKSLGLRLNLDILMASRKIMDSVFPKGTASTHPHGSVRFGVGPRCAAWLKHHYPRNRGKLIAREFGVSENTAWRWLSGFAPTTAVLEQMSALWGKTFLEYIFASPSGRTDGLIDQILRLQSEATARDSSHPDGQPTRIVVEVHREKPDTPTERIVVEFDLPEEDLPLRSIDVPMFCMGPKVSVAALLHEAADLTPRPSTAFQLMAWAHLLTRASASRLLSMFKRRDPQ